MVRIGLVCLLLLGAASRGHVKLIGVTYRDGSTGDKSKRVARKVKSAYLDGIRRCYLKTLDAHPAAHGELAIDLVVAEVGRVERAEVAGVDDDLDGCVRDRAVKWLLPPPVSDTFEFRVRVVLTP